jgi:hypothetical protein
MRTLIGFSAVLVLALLGIAGYWAFDKTRKHSDPFENVKAGVIQTSAPLSLTAARTRPDCPISLPETATNIQYAVWSLWKASQTFVRFDAPISDCLEHADMIMQPYAQRAGVSVASTNVVGPLPAPFIVSPKDLTVPWFDLPRFSAGVQFEISDGRGPTVWVDTNRGCFYYAWNE